MKDWISISTVEQRENENKTKVSQEGLTYGV